MKIVMCRVDERLVHGQVIASWSKILSIRQILVIDDQLAKDSFMGTVLAMAAPSGVKVELVSVDEAVRRIQKDGTQDGVNTMLLFKGPQCALALVEKGVEIRELNMVIWGLVRPERQSRAMCMPPPLRSKYSKSFWIWGLMYTCRWFSRRAG